MPGVGAGRQLWGARALRGPQAATCRPVEDGGHAAARSTHESSSSSAAAAVEEEEEEEEASVVRVIVAGTHLTRLGGDGEAMEAIMRAHHAVQNTVRQAHMLYEHMMHTASSQRRRRRRIELATHRMGGMEGEVCVFPVCGQPGAHRYDRFEQLVNTLYTVSMDQVATNGGQHCDELGSVWSAITMVSGFHEPNPPPPAPRLAPPPPPAAAADARLGKQEAQPDAVGQQELQRLTQCWRLIRQSSLLPCLQQQFGLSHLTEPMLSAHLSTLTRCQHVQPVGERWLLVNPDGFVAAATDRLLQGKDVHAAKAEGSGLQLGQAELMALLEEPVFR